MADTDAFDLENFTPYLLNRAAEASGLAFQVHYRDAYGMLRTEWRVLFHLGRHGALTASEICERAGLHKTKVSRAVAALEAKRFLRRQQKDEDRRQEALVLTGEGGAVFAELCGAARRFDAALMVQFSGAERAVLRRCLKRIAGL